jgi:hypothetical protein
MKFLKLEFQEGGPASKRILACAACLLQVSAQDQVGDSKMREAMALLQDKNLPFCFSEGVGADSCDDNLVATVKNFQFLSDQTAIDVFDERLRCISEAASLWSKVYCVGQKAAVEGWIVVVNDHLRFFDELLCLFLAGLFNLKEFKPLFGDSGGDGIKTVDEVYLEAGALGMQQLALFKDLYRKHIIDESPLKDFLGRYLAFVEKSRISFPQLAVDETNTMLQHLLHNHGLREKIYDVFSAMSNFDHILATPRAAVDDWKAKRQVQASGPVFWISAVLSTRRWCRPRAPTFSCSEMKASSAH